MDTTRAQEAKKSLDSLIDGENDDLAKQLTEIREVIEELEVAAMGDQDEFGDESSLSMFDSHQGKAKMVAHSLHNGLIRLLHIPTKREYVVHSHVKPHRNGEGLYGAYFDNLADAYKDFMDRIGKAGGLNVLY